MALTVMKRTRAMEMRIQAVSEPLIALQSAAGLREGFEESWKGPRCTSTFMGHMGHIRGAFMGGH
jgi:hypothetical protein